MQKWIVEDCYGNTIYFTKECWLPILESRPELEPYHDLFPEMLRNGRRPQDPLVPNESLYTDFCPLVLECKYEDELARVEGCKILRIAVAQTGIPNMNCCTRRQRM
jgi:hypothetical protein